MNSKEIKGRASEVETIEAESRVAVSYATDHGFKVEFDTDAKLWNIIWPNGEMDGQQFHEEGEVDAQEYADSLDYAFRAGYEARWSCLGNPPALERAHRKIGDKQFVRGGLPFINAESARVIVNDLAAELTATREEAPKDSTHDAGENESSTDKNLTTKTNPDNGGAG